MSQTVDDVLRSAKLYSDGRLYRLVKLPQRAITLAAGIVAEIGRPYCALIVDKDEVTLLMPDEARADFRARLRQAQASERAYRLITLDLALDPELVGLIARLAAALAAVDIPILAFAAYSRDHLLVPAEDFDKAMRALSNLHKESA
ncbi:MAG: ACT domain-containing protein [Chloroflexi bacterium]|nr:ACT domain-containing protein [Chloroflexota bacterium]